MGNKKAAVSVLTERTAKVGGIWCDEEEGSIFFLLLLLFDQQSEYNVFHKLMSWKESSLWTF